MDWTGKWRNQYGSILNITRQVNGKLEGYFQSAIDETTKGQELPLSGVYKDNLIGITCAGGDHVVTYTGMFYEGKMETMWQLVASEILTATIAGEKAAKKPLAWWQSIKTNADTFERI
jgi:hypothetical protein